MYNLVFWLARSSAYILSLRKGKVFIQILLNIYLYYFLYLTILREFKANGEEFWTIVITTIFFLPYSLVLL